ncbi:unnamed protein product [Ilex paraguariensis]|uniref:Uncharacterized protein n=1 Tax=Ilex paraguariensis TaxID=185542 RepID=A0ABC8SDL4_9AQUA
MFVKLSFGCLLILFSVRAETRSIPRDLEGFCPVLKVTKAVRVGKAEALGLKSFLDLVTEENLAKNELEPSVDAQPAHVMELLPPDSPNLMDPKPIMVAFTDEKARKRKNSSKTSEPPPKEELRPACAFLEQKREDLASLEGDVSSSLPPKSSKSKPPSKKVKPSEVVFTLLQPPMSEENKGEIDPLQMVTQGSGFLHHLEVTVNAPIELVPTSDTERAM